ncbi:MAG TPA: MFS transporter [Polyangiaceae bacterium]|nr:MFS transporter [Polyangiaceae bacterium]
MFRRELRDYRFFLASRVASMLGHQITSVVIGWQVFSLTGRAMDLGYVGLAQFLPAVALSLVTGQIIDRVDRRRVLMLCYAVEVACTLCLLALTRAHNRALWPIYAVLVVFGTARAFSGPSSQALAPNLVSRALLPRAVAWSSTAWQLSVIVGPALGGAVYGALGPAAAYGTSMVLLTGAGLATAFVRGGGPSARAAADGAAPTESKFAKLFAGLRYVFRERAILGTLSLDLFAVLLGGAVALLPMFAASLGGGPLGLGLLRSAPAVGASATALFLSFFPLQRRAGRRMLAAVGVFGLATIAFGLSKSFPLSLACLVVLGAADMVSVVVRRTLLQVRVPDAMRGRVYAVTDVFVGASNELGEFESGLTAAWLGPEVAVIAGGVGTCLIVAAWTVFFPTLRDVDGLE